MTTDDVHDALVLGGGPAGLQAALSLGRLHRSTVLVDSGRYRNGPVRHMHNVLGHDGLPPAELRARGREELRRYDTVEVIDSAVVSLREVSAGGPSRFEAELGDGRVVVARAVVLATGARDELPAIPGLEELWGEEAAQCPFCHGHELAGRRIAVLGAQVAGHLVPMLSGLTDDLVVLTDVDDAAPVPAPATTAGGRVERVTREDGRVRVDLRGGASEVVDGIFLRPVAHQAAPFAERLGLAFTDSGAVRIDIRGRSSLRGVYAAGDMAHHPELPMAMPSVANSVAAGAMAGGTALADLLSGALG